MTLFIKQHWFTIATIAILLLAILLRIYSYDNRWGLAYDQSHDALVAREALRQHKIPLLGPFSSAGPFVTGPEWYWFIIVGTILYPFAVITPWILMTCISVVFVYLMMVIGKKTCGSFFSLSLGLLSAVSSAEISQGLNLANQSPLAFLSALSIFSIIMYLQTKNIWYLFLDGLFISIGINTHLQGVLLLPLLVLALLIQKPSIKGICLACIGFVLPFLPLLFFDSTHHFYDLRSMWQYYHHDQYAISLDQLGRNWRNYLGVFWPASIAYITGGTIILSYLLIGLFILTFSHALYKRKLSKIMLVILITLLISIIFLRYTRTPLFNSYLTFLHPWILLITAWVISYIFSRQRLIGLIILILFVIGSVNVDLHEIVMAKNFTAAQSISWKEFLQKKLPDKKFVVYDYQYKTTGASVPLTLFLDVDQKISDNGMKIGLRIATQSAIVNHKVIFGKKGEYQLFDLDSSSSASLKKDGWIVVNPGRIYHETQEWYIDKKL